MNSPIRYFGGKGVMHENILSQFPSDFGEDDTRTTSSGDAETYIEPFGGAATILFQKKPIIIQVIYIENKKM
jgi:site-specific DNA-adenine methylase